MRRIITYLAGAALCCQVAQAATFSFFERKIADTIYRWRWGYLAAPAAVVGLAAVNCTPLVGNVNNYIKDRAAAVGFRSKMDDYLQYAPAAAALALEAAGVRGQNRLYIRENVFPTFCKLFFCFSFR